MRRPGGRDLARVDQAMLRLRRMWDAPRGIAHEGGVVEGSTLLVSLAVADTAGAVGVAEVADALGVAPSTASRLVARAAEAGMVTREVSTTDPRRAALELTATGTRLVEASRRYRAAQGRRRARRPAHAVRGRLRPDGQRPVWPATAPYSLNPVRRHSHSTPRHLLGLRCICRCCGVQVAGAE